MVEFRQKVFTEYDAMKSLYEELKRDNDLRNRVTVINSTNLIPILKGNNIVIERFVISDYLFSKSKYRMYIKIGARAKLPEEFRLPHVGIEKHALGSLKIGWNNKIDHKQLQENHYSDTSSSHSVFEQRIFKGKGGQNNNNNGGGGYLNASASRFGGNGGDYIDISYEVEEILGDSLEYNKQDRSLVLEFTDIWRALRALKILPFGLNYKIYLLDL